MDIAWKNTLWQPRFCLRFLREPGTNREHFRDDGSRRLLLLSEFGSA